ncbi:MAG: hypothetical protein ACRCTA_02090 [Bacilli bacterium]
MKQIKFIPFIVYNTTGYLPYILLIVLANNYQFFYPGYVLVLLFFLFRYTGVFLLSSFSYFEEMNSLKALKISTLGCTLAFIIAFFGKYNSYLLLVAAIMLGIASSIQLPLYNTILLRYEEKIQKRLKPIDFIEGLVFLVLVAGFFIFLTMNSYPEIAALLYAGLYLATYYQISLNKVETDKEIFVSSKRFQLDTFLFFILATALIVITKLLSYNSSDNYLLVLFAFGVSLISTIPFAKKRFIDNRRRAPIFWLASILGEITNFYFLFGTISGLALHTTTFIIVNVYVSYLIGNFLAFIMMPLFYKKIQTKERLPFLIGVTMLAIILTNISWFVTGIILGCVSTIWNSRLNRVVYDNAVFEHNSIILIKARYGKIGSIFAQVFTTSTIIITAFILNHQDLPLFQIITGKDRSYMLEAKAIFSISNLIMSLFYCLLFIYWYLKVDKDVRDSIFKLK